jgi:Domain of unknown function (DUF4279)
MSLDREYAGRVSLLITGVDSDPSAVTRRLGLRSTQSWAKGEFKRAGKQVFKTRHDEGGWKRLLGQASQTAHLEEQLRMWLRVLHPRTQALHELNESGLRCRLVWFAASAKTVSIIVPSSLQSDLAALGLDWEISVLRSARSSA